MGKNQYSHYFVWEAETRKQGYQPERTAMVKEFTGGAKTGLKQLSHIEYTEFLKFCKRMANSGKIAMSAENRMRRKIIALFCQMGYTCQGSADMRRIDEWCQTYGIYKRRLQNHNKAELAQLVSQVQKVYATFQEAV